MESILKVEHLEKYYGNRGNVTKAVDDISFTVTQGEYIGIMGASGSGKTTLLNCISTIDSATAGHIFIRGQDVTQLKAKELSRFRRERSASSSRNSICSTRSLLLKTSPWR